MARSIGAWSTARYQIQQKATYPAIHGIEASRARAAFLIRDAEEALRVLLQGPQVPFSGPSAQTV